MHENVQLQNVCLPMVTTPLTFFYTISTHNETGLIFLRTICGKDEWLDFKVKELQKYKHSAVKTFASTLKHFLLTMLASYPNIWRLCHVHAVIGMSNAECERGFSLMKLIKGDHLNRMETATIDIRILICFKGPPLESEECDTLVKKAARAFWAQKLRYPKRAAGAHAAHDIVKQKNGIQNAEKQRRQEDETQKSNTAIAATGTPSSAFQFERTGFLEVIRPHNFQFKSGQNIARCVDANDDSKIWVLGKIMLDEVSTSPVLMWHSTEGA